MTARMLENRSAGEPAPAGPSTPVEARAEALIVAGCELCEAARLTPWWYEDDLCWVADCEACDAPMVVWRQHGDRPTEEEEAAMIGRLEEVASSRFGSDGFRIDRVMRQIPDHFHAHARPRGAFWGRSRRDVGGPQLRSQVDTAR